MVYDPLRNEMFYAERNEGSVLNGMPIEVSRKKRLTESTFGIDIYHTPSLIKRELRILQILANKVQVVRSFFSGALELCYLSCGRIDIRIDDSYKPWDVSAGYLIAAESGARVTDMQNRKWTLKSKSLVAANPMLHHHLIDLFQKQLK